MIIRRMQYTSFWKQPTALLDEDCRRHHGDSGDSSIRFFLIYDTEAKMQGTKRYLLLTGVLILTLLSIGSVVAQDEDYTPNLDEITIMAPNPRQLPTARESNPYLQELESRLGIRLNFNWVPSSDFNAILSATLASGDLPDVIAVTGYSPTLVDALRAGAFLNVSELGLPQDARGLPALESVVDAGQWPASSLNGVNYGIPHFLATMQLAGNIRGDWMEAVGMPDDPQTVEELRDLLVAFAENDPDGNGQDDTYGFCITSSSDRFSQGGWGMFMQSFGVPNQWRVEPDGTLINADVTPEMRATLEYMADLYAAGVFDPDFAALPFAEVRAQFQGNGCGGIFGNMAAVPESPQYGGGLRSIVPDAEIHFLVPPMAEGFDPVMWSSPGWERIMLINASFASNPDAVEDILKVIDFWLDPANEEFLLYGIEGIHHTIDENGVLVTTEQGQADIGWIRAWGPRPISTIPQGNYNTPEHVAYIASFINDRQDIIVGNATWGLWPELGMDNPEAVLFEMATNTFDAIVRGTEPIEAFDEFVETWYEQGGQDLTDAYTAAYQASMGGS